MSLWAASASKVFLFKDEARVHQVLEQLKAKVLHFERRPFAGKLSGQSCRPMHLFSLELQSEVAFTLRSRFLDGQYWKRIRKHSQRTLAQ